MCTNNLKKLSIFAVLGLLLLAAGSQAALIHYWPFNLPDPNRNEGVGAGYPPHDVQLVDCWGDVPGNEWAPPTLVAGKLGKAFDLGAVMPPYSSILIGGNNVSGSQIVDGTLPSPPITVSFWFYPHLLPPPSGIQFLLANWSTSDNTDRFYMSLYTHIDGGPSGVNFSLGSTKDYGKGVVPVAPYIVAQNAWNHMMMSVRRTGTWAVEVVYTLNGGPARTVTAETIYDPAQFDRGNKRVGTNGNQTETGKTVKGKFDDVAIWNEILPQPASGFNAAKFIWNNGAGRPANVASGRVAYDPVPADKSVGNAGITQLQWRNSPRLTLIKVNVYMSDVLEDLIELQDEWGNNTNIPLTPVEKRIAANMTATQNSLSTLPITLPEGDDIYWRVDTVSTTPGDVNTFYGPVWKFSVSNAPPQVNAGNDLFRYLDEGTATINLSGVVTDDGLPVGAPVTCTWKDPEGNPLTTNVNQVGNVYTCTAQDTQTETGYYTYTLVADDTTGQNSDEVVVAVMETPCLAAKADPMYYVNVKNESDLTDDCFVTFKDFALAINSWKVCTALDGICD